MYADVLLRGELVLFKHQDTLRQRHLQVRIMQSSTSKNSQIERQDSKIEAHESIEIVPNYNWSFPVKKLLVEAIHLKIHYQRLSYILE